MAGAMKNGKGSEVKKGLGKEGVHFWKPPVLATGVLCDPGVTPKSFFPIGISARWSWRRKSRKHSLPLVFANPDRLGFCFQSLAFWSHSCSRPHRGCSFSKQPV